MNKITDRAKKLAEKIGAQRETLITSLLNYESFETAVDEIERSIDCLLNIHKEGNYLKNCSVNSTSSFLPANLPLYSLILFGIVPGYVSKTIYLRPPVLVRDSLNTIYKILDINTDFPNLKISHLERGLFLSGYASLSDVVLFTGTYKNAVSVHNFCKRDSLFIYNGPGINPIVVGQNADLELAIQKSIKARVFNSGQDCAGPDSIIVHSSISQQFLKRLIDELLLLKVGEYTDREVRIGKLTSNERIVEVERLLNDNLPEIIYGGAIDFCKSIVYPTVLASRITQKQNYTEWFSPVFYISIFENNDELNAYFQNPSYKDFAMYISIFGNVNYNIENSVVLKNKIILDVERGNNPYGGYGQKANFSFCRSDGQDKYNYRPMLISREIHEWQKTRNL